MLTTFNGDHSATSGFISDQFSRQQTIIRQDYPLLAWVADELRKIDSLKSENELIQTARVLIRDALNGAPTLSDSAPAQERNRFRRKIA
jgi:hypothetical protein